jgi:putative FmdB family regulatory protein
MLGKSFEVKQSIHDKALSRCPSCGGHLRKLISRINISTPKTNSELRDFGFTKLVKRDDGVYENVTARNNDSRLVIRDKP